MRGSNNKTEYGSIRTISEYDKSGSYIYEVGDYILYNGCPYIVDEEFAGIAGENVEDHCTSLIDLMSKNDSNIITTRNFPEKLNKIITGLSFNSPIDSLDYKTFESWAKNTSTICAIASTTLGQGETINIGLGNGAFGTNDTLIMRKYPFTSGVVMQELLVVKYWDERKISKYYRTKMPNENSFGAWQQIGSSDEGPEYWKRKIDSEIDNIEYIKNKIDCAIKGSYSTYTREQITDYTGRAQSIVIKPNDSLMLIKQNGITKLYVVTDEDIANKGFSFSGVKFSIGSNSSRENYVGIEDKSSGNDIASVVVLRN